MRGWWRHWDRAAGLAESWKVLVETGVVTVGMHPPGRSLCFESVPSACLSRSTPDWEWREVAASLLNPFTKFQGLSSQRWGASTRGHSDVTTDLEVVTTFWPLGAPYTNSQKGIDFDPKEALICCYLLSAGRKDGLYLGLTGFSGAPRNASIFKSKS